MNQLNKLTIFLAVLALGGSANSAWGYPVTFDFAGEITSVYDPTDLLAGAVTVGSPFSGSYTFESTSPDNDPGEPRRGLYDDAITAVSGQVAGLPFLGPLGQSNVLRIDNGLNDAYRVSAEVDFLAEILDFHLYLGDTTGTVFKGDSLPLFLPDVSVFTSAGFFVADTSEDIPIAVHGEIGSIVPEPTTALLMAIVGPFVFRRRHSGSTIIRLASGRLHHA